MQLRKKTLNKMKNQLLGCVAFAALSVLITGCGKPKSSGGASNGQLMGVAYGAPPGLSKPYGMVHIPQGTFHMGPSDEDINYAYTARNRQMSINGFWMDATEITNAEYKQFVFFVRDS
ncbi:MAG: formylglycine-generating enzyme family protein, partial [Bacteroidota bacterium]